MIPSDSEVTVKALWAYCIVLGPPMAASTPAYPVGPPINTSSPKPVAKRGRGQLGSTSRPISCAEAGEQVDMLIEDGNFGKQNLFGVNSYLFVY